MPQEAALAVRALELRVERDHVEQAVERTFACSPGRCVRPASAAATHRHVTVEARQNDDALEHLTQRQRRPERLQFFDVAQLLRRPDDWVTVDDVLLTHVAATSLHVHMHQQRIAYPLFHKINDRNKVNVYVRVRLG